MYNHFDFSVTPMKTATIAVTSKLDTAYPEIRLRDGLDGYAVAYQLREFCEGPIILVFTGYSAPTAGIRPPGRC